MTAELSSGDLTLIGRRRPLLQHSRPLSDCQPCPWSLLDKPLKDTLGLGKAVPGEQQFFDALSIPASPLDLEEVAPVGVERVVGFFVGPRDRHPRLKLIIGHMGEGRISSCLDQSPHHIPANYRQGELRPLLFRKIENALTKLFKYAAVMCEASHRTNLYHCPLIAKLAAYRAQAEASDPFGLHHRSQIQLRRKHSLRSISPPLGIDTAPSNSHKIC